MLKKIYINGRSVPVPIPVRTLFEASTWIANHFVPDGSTITKVILDGKIYDESWWNPSKSNQIELKPESRLELRIESPIDLTVQTLDAIHNFAEVILRGAKQLAVEMWQTGNGSKVTGSNALSEDCSFVRSLIDHTMALTCGMDLDMEVFCKSAKIYEETLPQLIHAIDQSDWKGAARILLNRIEPVLKDLIVQADSLQIRLLATRPKFSVNALQQNQISHKKA
jgi:hypothetical protein